MVFNNNNYLQFIHVDVDSSPRNANNEYQNRE